MCRYISDIPNIGYKDNENESSWVNNLLYIGGGIAGGIIGGACLVWLGIRCYKPVVKNIDVSVPGVSNKVTMVSCAQIEKDGETKYIELNDPQSCVLNESGEICYKIYKDNQAILAPKVNLIKIESHGITNYLPKEEYDKKFFKNKGCTMVSEAEKKAYDYYIKNKPKPFESSANIDDNIHLSGTMPQVNEE